MLEWCIGGIRCRVSLLFPALVTTLLLWQPDGLTVSCLLASLVHEGGHLAAMLAVGVPPHACTLGAFGMRMELGNSLMGYGRNLVVSVAGPLANALAAATLFMLGCPTAAVVHLMLAALNLFPAAALDGGEMLRCGLCLLGLEPLAGSVLRLSSALTLLPLAAVSMWLFLNGENPTLLIISGYLAVLVFFSDKCEKTLDKMPGCWYNHRDE